MSLNRDFMEHLQPSARADFNPMPPINSLMNSGSVQFRTAPVHGQRWRHEKAVHHNCPIGEETDQLFLPQLPL
jgi:hypothetical protein